MLETQKCHVIKNLDRKILIEITSQLPLIYVMLTVMRLYGLPVFQVDILTSLIKEEKKKVGSVKIWLMD